MTDPRNRPWFSWRAWFLLDTPPLAMGMNLALALCVFAPASGPRIALVIAGLLSLAWIVVRLRSGRPT